MPASTTTRSRMDRRLCHTTTRAKYHYRGPLTPKIQCLPTELLLEIFLHCRDDCQEGMKIRGDASKKANPYSWIRITHVCRLWRDIAIAYPLLWSQVVPCELWSLFSMVLRRSRNTPLSVRCTPCCWDTDMSFLTLDYILKQHLHRVERLTLRGKIMSLIRQTYGPQWPCVFLSV